VSGIAEPARVVVVEDHPLYRAGIRHAIESSARLRLVGESDSFAGGLALLGSERPDLALIDHHLPDRNGIELLREGRSKVPDTKFVMLTAFEDDEVLFEALALGAQGFLMKQTDSTGLIDALERLHNGESVIDPAVTGRVFDHIRQPTTEDDRLLASLNSMERQVLGHLTRGLTNKQIAPLIHVSDTTVKNYVSGILRKLGLSRRTEAAVFALGVGSRTAGRGRDTSSMLESAQHRER
jgi:DNA-binding NarL/FixJ family response regulator